MDGGVEEMYSYMTVKKGGVRELCDNGTVVYLDFGDSYMKLYMY